MIRTGVVLATEPNPFGENSPTSNLPKPLTDANFCDHVENPDLVSVELDTIVGCGTCSNKGGCGVTLLPSQAQKIMLKCTLESGVNVSTGDTVQIVVDEPDGAWLKLVGLAYGLPTGGMLAGAFIGNFLAQTQFGLPFASYLVVSGFGLGLAGGLLLWNRQASSVFKDVDGSYQARIVGVMLATTS